MEFLQYAEQIIEDFEKNSPMPCYPEEWEDGSEIIRLYLAALDIVRRYN